MAAYKKGLPAITSQRTAEKTLNNLAAQFPLPYTGCKNDIEREDEGGGFSWRVIRSQYVDSLPVQSRRLDGNIEPYKGRFYQWFMNDCGTLVAPTGSLLAERRARQIATDAVAVYAASFMTPSETILFPSKPDWLGWQEVGGSSTLTRRVYWYTFALPPIADPNKNNPDAKWRGRSPMDFTVHIDAETGEVWEVRHSYPQESIATYVKQNGSVVSPRCALFKQILRDNSLKKTALLFAGGKPIEAVAPSKTARRFGLTITPSNIPDLSRYMPQMSEAKIKEWRAIYNPFTVAFGFNKTAKCVTWETEPGKWAGLALSDAQTASIEKWLAAHPAKSK